MTSDVTPRVSVIGLGYVGLPLAVALAKRFAVVGIDIDQQGALIDQRVAIEEAAGATDLLAGNLDIGARAEAAAVRLASSWWQMGAPAQILIHDRDGRLVVSNYGARSLSVVDPATLKELHHVPMEAKVPKGHVHDPYSYEIETWTAKQAQFPREQRVVWMKPARTGDAT